MEAGQFFQENVLSNLVVMDQIFSYVKRSDLMKFSLISKKWVSPCRQVLRRRHPCIVRLKPTSRRRLETTLELLKNSTEVLYNGVCLDFVDDQHWKGKIDSEKIGSQLIDGSVKTVLKKICDKIPHFKYLVISFEGSHTYDLQNAKILRFYLELLPIESVEKLEIRGKFEITPKSTLTNKRKFSKLKALDMEMTKYPPCFAQFMDNFPVLEEWSRPINFVELPHFIRAHRAYLVKMVFIGRTIKPERVDQVEKAHLCLRSVNVDLEPAPETVDLFRRIISSSMSSLERVEMRFGFFWPLIRSEISPLINVKKLVVQKYDGLDSDDENFEFDEDDDDEGMKEKILHDMDTKRVFPNAKLEYHEAEDFDCFTPESCYDEDRSDSD